MTGAVFAHQTDTIIAVVCAALGGLLGGVYVGWWAALRWGTDDDDEPTDDTPEPAATTVAHRVHRIRAEAEAQRQAFPRHRRKGEETDP